jgi:hypothetical protein
MSWVKWSVITIRVNRENSTTIRNVGNPAIQERWRANGIDMIIVLEINAKVGKSLLIDWIISKRNQQHRISFRNRKRSNPLHPIFVGKLVELRIQ